MVSEEETKKIRKAFYLGDTIRYLFRSPYIKVGNEVYRIITPVNFYRLLELPENLVRKEIGEILNKVREDKKKMKVVKMIGLPIKAKYTMLDLAMVKAYKRIKGIVDYDINLTSVVTEGNGKSEIIDNMASIFELIEHEYDIYYFIMFYYADVPGASPQECEEIKYKDWSILYKKTLFPLATLYRIIFEIRKKKVIQNFVKFILDKKLEVSYDSSIKYGEIAEGRKEYFTLIPEFIKVINPPNMVF